MRNEKRYNPVFGRESHFEELLGVLVEILPPSLENSIGTSPESKGGSFRVWPMNGLENEFKNAANGSV